MILRIFALSIDNIISYCGSIMQMPFIKLIYRSFIFAKLAFIRPTCNVVQRAISCSLKTHQYFVYENHASLVGIVEKNWSYKFLLTISYALNKFHHIIIVTTEQPNMVWFKYLHWFAIHLIDDGIVKPRLSITNTYN